MRFRGLLVIFVLGLLLAAPAGGRLLDVGELPDAAGDGAPDITRVRVGSNATAVTFIVDLANQTTLAGDQGIFIFIDSDLNPETGGMASSPTVPDFFAGTAPRSSSRSRRPRTGTTTRAFAWRSRGAISR